MGSGCSKGTDRGTPLPHKTVADSTPRNPRSDSAAVRETAADSTPSNSGTDSAAARENPRKPDMLKIQGMYEGTEQTMICKKGTNTMEFCNLFRRDLAKKGVEMAKPLEHVRYDDKLKKYVPVGGTETLEDGMQFQALMKDSKKAPICLEVSRNFSSEQQARVSLLCFPFKPPNITTESTYQLWSLASTKGGRFLRRDPENGDVKCNGISDDTNTYVTAKFRPPREVSISHNCHNCFAFLFNHANKKYAMKGNGKGNDVKTEEEDQIDDDSDLFELEYYGHFTRLKKFATDTKKSKKPLYLGCDHTGKTTLMKNSENPPWHPHTFFIHVKVDNANDN